MTTQSAIPEHKCTFGIEIHSCESDACTLTHLGDMLRLFADTLSDPCGGMTDYYYLTEAGATAMASIIAEIRETAWAYNTADDDWCAVLYLLDFVEDVLQTQYRCQKKTGVHLGDAAVTGIKTMLLITELILRSWALSAVRTREKHHNEPE